MNTTQFAASAVLTLTILGGAACSKRPSEAPSSGLSISTLPRVATVDERYQSFNVEMIEVTGGRFWKPYKDIQALLKDQPKPAGTAPAGMNPDLYQQRAPTDLNNGRLRKLAAALAPSYMRVSGTWANTTYFHDSDGPPPATPPK